MSISRIILRGCQIDDDMLKTLSNGIEDSYGLKYLDLKDNKFKKYGLSYLIKALLSTKSIEHLMFRGLKI